MLFIVTMTEAVTTGRMSTGNGTMGGAVMVGTVCRVGIFFGRLCWYDRGIEIPIQREDGIIPYIRDWRMAAIIMERRRCPASRVREGPSYFQATLHPSSE
jgi:hypothetical protein